MNIVKSSDLRKKCSINKYKTPCFVCRKHSIVTQKHHVYSLENLSIHIESRQLSKFIEPPTVCLCPTCHAYVHTLIKNDSLIHSEFFDLTEEEIKRLRDVYMMQFNYLDCFIEWLHNQR